MNFNPVNRKAFALLILVLALGIALGAVGAVVVNQHVYGARPQVQNRPSGPPPPGGPRNPAAGIAHAVDRMAHEVDLSADQQKQVSDILQDTQKQYDSIREQMDPLFDKARDNSRDRIRQILTSDQLTKFNDFMARVDEERRRRAAGGGPGGPGQAPTPAPAH